MPADAAHKPDCRCPNCVWGITEAPVVDRGTGESVIMAPRAAGTSGVAVAATAALFAGLTLGGLFGFGIGRSAGNAGSGSSTARTCARWYTSPIGGDQTCTSWR